MTTRDEQLEVQTFDFSREVEIDAPAEITFEALLAELGPEGQMPGGKPFPMKIEPWPGGRWYRDLGNNAGHFWGHVQVIKPPGLLEISGPMFASYPAINHVQYRLTAEGGGTRLKITHRAFGQMPKDFMKGADEGWEYGLKRIREMAERRKSERRKEARR
jgi:uncharacterized protein YndB with AHSA1/START domain